MIYSKSTRLFYGAFIMRNRVKVEIGGEQYIIVAEDSEDYIRGIAFDVNERMNKIFSVGSTSWLSAAVLTAVNLADEYKKLSAASDNMRVQMKSYLDDAQRLRNELNELKQELAKLNKDKK